MIVLFQIVSVVCVAITECLKVFVMQLFGYNSADGKLMVFIVCHL